MQGKTSAAWSSERLDQLDRDARAALIAQLIQPFIKDQSYRDYFSYWEECGFHITPNSFYQPIPDADTLTDDLWARRSLLTGIDMNNNEQVNLIRNVFPQFSDECSQFATDQTDVPHEYYTNNGFFETLDASVAHCMVRYLKPRRILELGSGFSTRVMARAAVVNGDSPQYTVVDPYPGKVVRAGIPGVLTLLIQKVEKTDLEPFASLEDGDILFVDTSHVVKTGGEVNLLYLDVFPQLNNGVVVHIHDIFFPAEYPKVWLKEQRMFWTEQYLLQAFLCYNSAFEVLFANNYMCRNYPTDIRETFPDVPLVKGGGSIWIRRKRK